MPAPAPPPAGLGPATFLAAWPLGKGQSDAARLGLFAARLWGQTVGADTLGLRNQRNLGLHRALCGTAIEARVTCPDCATDNEAELPVAALLNLPDPPDAVVVDTADGPRRFGLPRLSDLDLPGLTRLVAHLALDPVALPDPALCDQVAAAWEEADPAGAIALDLTCSACGRALTASVDPAPFVARDLDLLADRLMREIDAIARAYGWSEDAILALPADRRRRYVALASAQPGPGRLA